MTNLILATAFQQTFNQLKTHRPHAVLLSGKKGVGLLTIARELSAGTPLITITPTALTKSSTTKQISVAMIRSLYDSVRTRNQRTVIIDDADTMTRAAQNAFLKLLEEPNSFTSFILTSHNPEVLLPTIRSRLTHYNVPFVETMALLEEQLHSVSDIKKRQILFLSTGRPAELYRLLHDDTYFANAVETMRLAKRIVSGSKYEQVVAVITAKRDRNATLDMIERIIDILTYSMSADSFHKIPKFVEAYSSIRSGGNAKLQLVQAML